VAVFLLVERWGIYLDEVYSFKHLNSAIRI